jgi:hypothetical protein
MYATIAEGSVVFDADRAERDVGFDLELGMELDHGLSRDESRASG